MSWTVGGDIYQYRSLGNINHTYVPSNQSNFPVYVKGSTLTHKDHFYANSKADGGDVRFTEGDGTTLLPLDLNMHDTSGKEGEYHFFVSSVAAGALTPVYMYYGNPALSQPAVGAAAGRNATWDTTYVGTWHMSEDPSLGAPQITDVTGNGHDGTSWGSMTTGDLVTGQLPSGALDFDGTDDTLGITTLTGFGAAMANVTVEFWVKTTDGTDGATYFGGRGNSSSQPRFRVSNYGSSTGQIGVEVYSCHATNKWLIGRTSGDTGILDGEWHHIVVTAEASTDTIVVYVDGVAEAFTYSQQQTPISFCNFAQQVFVSAWGDVGVPAFFANAIIDELRVANVIRSADYVTTAYNNQSNPGAFITFAPVEQFIPRILVA